MNNLFAQSYSTSDWEEIGEQLTTTDDEDGNKDWTNNAEELEELKEHPLNINTVTKEQLEQLPFLTDLQIEHILYYLYVNGAMKTIYELQMVEDMDRQTIQYLLPFIRLGEAEKETSRLQWKQVCKYGKHDLLARLDIPLNRKAGYKDYPDSVLLINPNKQYVGSPFYHSFKYAFHYKDKLFVGLTAEKDAGEPFFCKENKKGYDAYSFYFLARNIGKLKSLALGNYRLSYGQGLVMSSDYTMGKSASIATMGTKSNGIKKHSSTDEYNYFSGIAAAYQFKDFVLSTFYSHRKIDAVVENRLITSLKTDGMHRVVNDFEKRNNATIQLIGGNLTYSSTFFKLGLTGVYNFFNRPFIPELKPYSVFYPQGRNFYNLGLDYKFRWHKLTFFGETAMGTGGGMATLNVLQYTPMETFKILLLQRYYAKNYCALNARSISEGSGVRNESGEYIGIETNFAKYWKLFAYADVFHFPWLRYGVDKPSSGFDALTQLTYTPRRNLVMFFRYRYKVKDKNNDDPSTNIRSVCPYTQHKFRYQLGYALHDRISLRTTIDLVSVKVLNLSPSHGFMLLQNVSYTFSSLPLRVEVHYGLFDTDDYNSRISTYERGLLYSLSMPSFYGKGVRFALNIRYDFNSHFMAIMKFGRTNYLDRDKIGTGLEEIDDDSKMDLSMQVRYKF
ncbi:MAG: helix-hairpin-helix domain-containing protein [Bacteroidaceae bacterium]